MTENRKFGLTVGTAFIILAGILLWRDRTTPSAVVGTVGGILVLAALVIPNRLGPVHRGWMAMAHAISRVTTPLFMGTVYFVVVAPIGLIMRALGKNPLRRHVRNGSFWVDRRAEGALKSDLERMF